MQVKKIVSLCAVAFTAMAGQAHAAMTPAHEAIVDNAVSNGRVLFISGASATQKGFTGIIATMFTGTPVRLANTTASSKDFEAVAGVLAAGNGAWSGQNVIIIDRVKGGSVWGVNPVARAEAIESLNVTKATCGSAGAGTVASPYVCSTTPLAGYMVPDAGVSDVAPVLFQSPVNTEGEVAADSLTDAELASMSATPIYSLAFGVPVTNNVPLVNLNKAAVSAIMAGNVGTWNQVDASLPADDIVVCRRVPGSGTQAVDNLYFGNFPCGVSNVPADRDASGAWDSVARKFTVTGGTGGLVVVENSTSGDVRSCLDKAVTGGTFAGKDRDGNAVTVDFGAGGHKAVGVMSMDSLKDSKAAGNWQFRSLDGAGTITWDNTAIAPVTTGTGKFPTLANLIDGTWDLQGWISFQIPDRTTGAKKALAEAFLLQAQNPAILASITDLKNVSAAIPGGAYSGAQVLRAQYANNNQCAPLNRNF
ncbi:MAG: substrate-binding domain-containing protein [Azonexus sp.]|nr:substrate-binding domain-containing protein [Azonexus sp.]